MLALNASIEAARAGDSGRGFAVVASQISELAQNTQVATSDITSLIQNINAELAQANEDIVQNIQTISAITEEISAHSNETFNACEDNAQMVTSVRQIVGELNESAQRMQQDNRTA